MIVIRDSAGLVIASCSQLLPQAYLTCEVEALAAMKALTFAQVVGVSKAILEGDSKMLMKALVCDDVSMASHGSLIEDVKFNSRHAIIVSDLAVWMEDVPPQFVPAFQADLTCFS
ncbi:hypothetical protein SO802_010061 [Lithocarpus litseifolius]|uniref:RNase H type-1 domain-containing protein n=1 Tax=Lithocarpus litseifolius TaxID=425828 RepID=A0AAW2DG95_9ROSI